MKPTHVEFRSVYSAMEFVKVATRKKVFAYILKSNSTSATVSIYYP